MGQGYGFSRPLTRFRGRGRECLGKGEETGQKGTDMKGRRGGREGRDGKEGKYPQNYFSTTPLGFEHQGQGLT